MDLNLRIFPGELFDFISPNGAGKTTTVKILSAFLNPLLESSILME
jgi:ABC-type multidrug transport system ATPase subunit